MKALVIAEHADAATALAAGARSLADEVAVAIVGPEEVLASIADVAYGVAVPEGAVADDANETLAPLLEDVELVIAEPTRHIKSVAGKLAASRGASVITDVMSFENGQASQMYFGGVGIVERKAKTPITFLTVRPATFADMQATGSNGEAEQLEWVTPTAAVRFISSDPIEKAGVDLTKSEVVVAAGRGFAEMNDLDLARQLCRKIGAGLGCTRPLAEANDWMPSETYIGVSGLNLSPKVYIAVGISGQMQHMVGANHSGTIFAINKDESAPIFKQCDYGLVGDLKTILPALVEAL